MNFLKKLLKLFCSIFQNNVSSTIVDSDQSTNIVEAIVVPWPFETLQEDERISRFIFAKNHFNNVRPKYGAFLPAEDGDLSVYRTHNLSEEDIWELDRVFVTGQRTDGKVSKARGDLPCSEIFKAGVVITPEISSHPRHANISAYASEESAQRSQAQQLAEASKLFFKPT